MSPGVSACMYLHSVPIAATLVRRTFNLVTQSCDQFPAFVCLSHLGVTKKWNPSCHSAEGLKPDPCAKDCLSLACHPAKYSPVTGGTHSFCYFWTIISFALLSLAPWGTASALTESQYRILSAWMPQPICCLRQLTQLASWVSQPSLLLYR